MRYVYCIYDCCCCVVCVFYFNYFFYCVMFIQNVYFMFLCVRTDLCSSFVNHYKTAFFTLHFDFRSRVSSLLLLFLIYFETYCMLNCKMSRPCARLSLFFVVLVDSRKSRIKRERKKSSKSKLAQQNFNLSRLYSMRKTLVKIYLMSVFRLHPLDFF